MKTKVFFEIFWYFHNINLLSYLNKYIIKTTNTRKQTCLTNLLYVTYN